MKPSAQYYILESVLTREVGSKYVDSDKRVLKMLGLYLYTFITGHTSCNALGILNEITECCDKNVFLDKK